MRALQKLQRSKPKRVPGWICNICGTEHPTLAAAKECQRLPTTPHKYRVGTDLAGGKFQVKETFFRRYNPPAFSRGVRAHTTMYVLEMQTPRGTGIYTKSINQAKLEKVLKLMASDAKTIDFYWMLDPDRMKRAAKRES
ncbi:hypothetical protein HYW55_00080 [Candidatus Gottesmanbacteria bacterium]|nr:hypothetical protein [Candidatus Gottesmanbacteria bacterium]